MAEIKKDISQTDDATPVTASWRRIYSFVLIFLIIEVILFYYFTRFFD